MIYSKKFSWLVILSFLVLSSLGLYMVKSLKFNYDIESFFDKDSQQMQQYVKHRSLFENDNNFLLIGISDSTEVFNQDFMNRLGLLSISLSEVDSVLDVVSPTTIEDKIVTDFGSLSRPLIQYDSIHKLFKDKEKIKASQEYSSELFSSDWHSVLIQVKISEPVDFNAGQEVLTNIEHTVAEFGFDDAKYAGRINTRRYYVETMGQQSIIFAVIAILLLIAFLIYTFRSWQGVVLPLIILSITVVLTLAAVRVGIGEVDLMLSMLPTVVFVVGVSYTVHVISRYAEELLKTKDRYKAIKKAIREIWSTVAITVLTTSLGFLSLTLIQIRPIQNFAIYNSIGILIAGITSLTLLPALLLLISPEKIIRGSLMVSSSGLKHSSLIGNVLRKPRLVITTTGIFSVVFIVGSFNIKVNNNFLDDLNDSSLLGQELSYFESNFGGIRPFEMTILPSNDSSSVFTYHNIKSIEKVETYLRDSYGVNGIISPATIIKAGNKSYHGGKPKEYKLPETQPEMISLVKKLRRKAVFRKLETVVSRDLTHGRIYGRGVDYGSLEYQKKNELLNSFLGDHGLKTKFRLTGAAELMDEANRNISTNLFAGIGIGILVVTLIIGILFKSFRLAVISILPNLLPVLAVAGLMGLLGVDLKVSTSLTFTVIFGIAVDDTIHLFNRLKKELQLDGEMKPAMQRTYRSTGKAVVITSFVVSAGFLAFTSSEFQSLFYFGILISVGIIVALLADYFLLPVLISKVNPQRFNK